MVERLREEKNYDALLVKLFERLHNMQTISAKSSEKIKKIVDETLVHFIPFTAYLSNWQLGQELSRLCCQAGAVNQPDFLQEHSSFAY